MVEYLTINDSFIAYILGTHHITVHTHEGVLRALFQ